MIPWSRHWWQHLPAVSSRVVPGEIVYGDTIPESPNGVDVLFNYSGSQGPPPGWHLRPGCPAVGLRIVLEGQIHSCTTRKPPEHVQFAPRRRRRGVIECYRQGLDELPAVGHELIR